MPPNSSCDVPLTSDRPARGGGVQPLHPPVVDGQHLVASRLLEEEPLELGEPLGLLGRQVAGLAPVGRRVVQLPDVVLERRQLRRGHPRRRVLRDGRPAAVVDAAVADHLEVLRLVLLGRGRVVERVGHAHALHGALGDAVHVGGLRDAGRREHRRRDVDDVAELGAHLAARPIPVGQWTIVPLRVPPQWDATCLVHWYGVPVACAQPTA